MAEYTVMIQTPWDVDGGTRECRRVVHVDAPWHGARLKSVTWAPGWPSAHVVWRLVDGAIRSSNAKPVVQSRPVGEWTDENPETNPTQEVTP